MEDLGISFSLGSAELNLRVDFAGKGSKGLRQKSAPSQALSSHQCCGSPHMPRSTTQHFRSCQASPSCPCRWDPSTVLGQSPQLLLLTVTRCLAPHGPQVDRQQLQASEVDLRAPGRRHPQRCPLQARAKAPPSRPDELSNFSLRLPACLCGPMTTTRRLKPALLLPAALAALANAKG